MQSKRWTIFATVNEITYFEEHGDQSHNMIKLNKKPVTILAIIIPKMKHITYTKNWGTFKRINFFLKQLASVSLKSLLMCEIGLG